MFSEAKNEKKHQNQWIHHPLEVRSKWNLKKKKKRRHEMLERRNSGRRDPGVNNMRGKGRMTSAMTDLSNVIFFLMKI